MRVNITGKNCRVSDHLKDTIEKKVQKLGKYFSDDIDADVMLTEEKKYKKTEVTIKARGMIFRAEDKADEFYDGIDNVVAKLSSQMSRFKGKLQKKHKDNKMIDLGQVPEPEETEEIAVTRNKKFELTPMTVDEAVLQMEMLEHNFYVFLNVETDSVNVVYKRNEKDYGLLETTY
ncbi:MAG: ribosome-associated translation inhibitor RaiA [Firmicutes bacterium]|nr:ribosome-associated translation inhibitor RaiA [Bacillota bacterium]MBQ3964465.1 ribosome-associated translation inhibitor RaiA [Bacillota bacterium]